MASIYVHPYENTVGHYRAVLPHRHLSERLRREGIDLVLSDQVETTQPFDAYFLHRLINPWFLEFVKTFLGQGRKLLWELDDDLWHVPNWNPCASTYDELALDVLNWTRNAANRIGVSTEPLAAVIDRPLKTYVLPNLVDLDEWPDVTRGPRDRVRVLWAGSNSHKADLAEIVPAVDEVLQEFGDRVEIVFMGILPEQLADYQPIPHSFLAMMVPARRYGAALRFVHPVSLEDYPRTLCELAPDIALLPLCGDTFNASKSNNKFTEMTLAGAACIASDSEPFRCILPSVEGLVVGEGQWTWAGALRELIGNPTGRRDLHAAALTKVRRDYSWQGNWLVDNWFQFFKGFRNA